MKQSNLFDNANQIILDKYKYSFLVSAVGDSLGWPLEFKKKKGEDIEKFINWNKLVGGKWWGYIDQIQSGEYSDDTQLNLSVARSINSSGIFDPEYFGYLELPLWLNYERGGGRSIKTAAKNILKKKAMWYSNFYKTNQVSYYNAGANGAAMRNLPIALLGIKDQKRFVIDSVKNSIITHGHPRAIIGSILIGAAIIYFLRENDFKIKEFEKFILDILESSFEIANEDPILKRWMKEISNGTNYNIKYKKSIDEAKEFILNIKNYLTKDDYDYYNLTKSFRPEFKGSGISTTANAIYMAIKYLDKPFGAIIKTINMVGSDTDTIGNFVGSIIGAHYGNIIEKSKLYNLITQIQDKNYFEEISKVLWNINFGMNVHMKEGRKISKTGALLKILAWEIGLHDMFWEALDKGDVVVHPTLGRGMIEEKTIRKIRREDYLAKIFKINFQTGQTAYFHSRVSKDGFVKQSLGIDIDKELK